MEIVVIKNILDYQKGINLMEEEKQKIIAGQSDGKIFLLENNPVYSAGITSHTEKIDLAKSVIPLVKTTRGGKITYHGPGQRICYFVLEMKKITVDLRLFIEKIQEIIIDSLAAFGIDSYGDRHYPGVWIREGNKLNKIAALGLKITKGITSHGCAININNDLSPFNNIIPCGIDPTYRGITSLSKLLNCDIKLQEFDKIFIEEIKKHLTFSSVIDKDFF